MILTLRTILGVATGLAATGGIAYYSACLWSALDYLDQRTSGRLPENPSSAEFLPPVSILKPLKGEDPEMYESLRSHCLQDYPQFELLFGVSDPADPALRAVERLRKEFSEKCIEVVVTQANLGSNAKVSNLAQMVSRARYEHLIVSDSDIRVEPDYLRRVISPLEDSQVGLVTCLYRGVAGPTLASRLESLGISSDFSAGVLVARTLEGVRFALGSTMAFRRQDLQSIGGFESFVDYLADDYELGKRISERGLKVHLSEVVVETFLPAYDFAGFFEHQIRWARGVRDSRRAGYLGLLFTFGWIWAALAVLALGGSLWSWGLFGAAVILRVLVAIIVGFKILRDPQVPRFVPLLPLRDILALIVFSVSFTSNAIVWRGNRYQLKNGRLIRV